MSAEQRIFNAGATLANIAFNLAQRGPGEFTARDAMVLDQARKDWDAARSATQADAAEVGEDAKDAARWRMLPAFFEEYQIDAMKLYRDIDAALCPPVAAPADSSMGGGER